MSLSRSPEIAVVIPSHDRPLRLRWALNALMEQTLDRSRFEVLVGHDSSAPETEELLRTHPLAEEGVLRWATLEPGTAPPGRNRNAAWRMATAPLIAFTDDDCRPPPTWLERALAAAQAHPGAIIQGATVKDPDEDAAGHAPQYHSQMIKPPTPWAEACNIVYPRDVLERVGGFREDMYVGEDTELMIRARKVGAGYVGDIGVLTYHAVVETSLLKRLRGIGRWDGLPFLLKLHPEVRSQFPGGIFWKRTHVWFPVFLAGAVLERRNVLYGALCVPWVVHSAPRHGTDPRGRLRELAELPARAAVDTVEIATLIRGSIKHRTPLL